MARPPPIDTNGRAATTGAGIKTARNDANRQSSPHQTRAPATMTSSMKGSSNLRAPTELGQYERSENKTSFNSPALRNVRADPRIIRTRQRAQAAVHRICSPGAIKEEREIYQRFSMDDNSMTYCTSCTYRGMEVLVGTADSSCYLLCARTKVVLQTLDPPKVTSNVSSSMHPSPIISLRAHPATGQIIVVTADGSLCSYSPLPSNPLEVNFGRFHWYSGPTANCSRIFYSDKEHKASFAAARKKQGLEVSLADDFKVLLAHRDQLVVLDAKPELREAEMLWTTCLSSSIVTAQLSGDAQCIAVVLEPNSDDLDSADADGVHTLERDWEDGGPNIRNSNDVVATQTSSNSLLSSNSKDSKTPGIERTVSAGVIYKPGPFLVHSAPVTRLSFRGKGRETSNPPRSPQCGADEIPGNDLLLTVSEDNTAQIFGQSNWKPLTEWIMSPKTRVDWISGSAALTLGDLDGRSASSPRKKGTGSASSSRRPSGSNMPGQEGSEAHNEDVTNRHAHFATIPTHTTPVSKAGAWICEVSCDGQLPSMRLSRLTYLKRGADDLSPTLFESVTGYLPANAIYENLLLGNEDYPSTLDIEGLWPIWNPFVADSTPDPDNTSINETLRGSAMAFLGLTAANHVVGTGGTFFGDPQLIGTQCPPTEMRFTLAHPVSGHITVLEFPLYGDKSLTNLELGQPVHSVLALNELQVSGKRGREAVLDSESTDHGDGRLVAKLKPNNVVSLTWRQAGTSTLLPASWHSKDIMSSTFTELLSNTKTIRDESLVPAPLALRPFQLPRDLTDENDSFALVLWWPESGIAGAPPILLALTKTGCAVAFEVVTPLVTMLAWSDPNSVIWSSSSQAAFQSTTAQDDVLYDPSLSEYEVFIVPDPELGLGLRLESLDDGQPAIAGSFKRNPETSEILPAEKTGLITIGDELVSANGIALERKTFDEIINCVRELGASSDPEHPMRLRFRRQSGTPRARSNSGTSDGSSRRTVEHMFGVNHDLVHRKSVQNGSHEPASKPKFASGFERSAGSVGASVHAYSFKSPISGVANAINSDDARRNIFLMPASSEEDPLVAIMCCADGQNVLFNLLTLPGSEHSSSQATRLLHSFPAHEDGIDGIYFVDRQGTNYFLVVIEKTGRIRLLVATIDVNATNHTVRSFDLSTLPSAKPPSLKLRAHSVELFATIDTNTGSSDPLKVWSSKPHPGCGVSELKQCEDGDVPHELDYACSAIRIDATANVNSVSSVLEFSFVESGYLNSNPWLIVFEIQRATLHHRPGGSDEWVPLTVINYSQIPSSWRPKAGQNFDSPSFGCSARPSDVYPHLVGALCSSLPSSDEGSFLRTDWNPDSLLASLCLSQAGAEIALRSRMKDIFLWLCSEGASFGIDQSRSPLLCAPLPNFQQDSKHFSSKHSSLGLTVTRMCNDPDDLVKLKKLQKALAEASSDPGRLTSLNPQAPEQDISYQSELPPILCSGNGDDLALLWTLGELVINPPDFKSIDIPGQLFVFSSRLYDVLHKFVLSQPESKPSKFVAPSVLRRDQSSRNSMLESSGPGVLVSSSACLSALLSNSQERLLEWTKTTYNKLDWVTVRRNRIPFWLRSDESLARVSEEIGQTIFREKRDVMECALFFVIARKVRTLRNLAATDRSDSGTKFFNFLTSHDFSSERGRRAAEKNAFSLLRKCRYEVASAFFLLSEPPALQSALETIVSKLHDIDLAFMVARLMESKQLGAVKGSALGYGGSGFGGGAGYAGSGNNDVASVSTDSVKYEAWEPDLGNSAKKLLVDRLFKLSAGDNSLSALQLLWMRKREEASWWLPGFIVSSHTSDSGYRLVDDVQSRIAERLRRRGDRSRLGAIAKANAIIDFASIPLLQRNMNVSIRSRYAGCLLVCDQLIARGVEIPCLWTVMDILDKSSNISENQKATVANQEHPAVVASSIFDSFDVSQVAKIIPSKPEVQSSIFDTFDVPHVAKNSASQPVVQSSIFDNFEVPHVAKKNLVQPSVQSSIFDSFDVPQVAKTKPSQSVVQSSIFDAFDMPSTSSSTQPSSTQPHTSDTQVGAKKETNDTSPCPEIHLSIATKPPPEVWFLWKDRIVLFSIARRLLREVATVAASFSGFPPAITVEDFHSQNRPLFPSGEVLQASCDTTGVLFRTRDALKQLATASGIDELTAVNAAVKLLGGSLNHFRVLLSVLLYSTVEKFDLAESMVRAAAGYLIRQTGAFALAYDDACERRRTRFQASSSESRLQSARVSWQLEICLWLNRSGLLPLSSLAFKEATVSVRLGVLHTCWNRSPDAIEALLRCEPDVLMDDDEGMHLWSSLKHTVGESLGDRTKKTSSGGWEFFVDCKRSEATRILRESPTGSFIIRPHPNDHGVFTLSFKTNLVPGEEAGVLNVDTPDAALEGVDGEVQGRLNRPSQKSVKKDDIVQHAIIRLSDSGFRCGSFGPFTSLLDLLESVSESLPFELRFDLPPSNRAIREEGSQASPNTLLFRRLAVSHKTSMEHRFAQNEFAGSGELDGQHMTSHLMEPTERNRCFGAFLDLLVLSKLRRQLSGVAAVRYEDNLPDQGKSDLDRKEALFYATTQVASSIVGPMLGWCRSLEMRVVFELAPSVAILWRMLAQKSQALMDVSEQSIEITLGPRSGNSIDSGDFILRSMIQRNSGVEFSTLRLVDGGECSMVVLFSKNEAIEWLVSSGIEPSEADADHRLARMERERVIEQIDFSRLPLKQRPADLHEGVRYRFVDPWEVEAVSSREGETTSALLGRQHFLGFSLGRIGLACESDFRLLGGIPLLELWMSASGGVFLSRALAAVHPPWERASGGDLQVRGGVLAEPEPFANSIRQHLYRNALFQRLELPQRFLALVQVELLDLKNLTSPGGALSMSVYALLRLKRRGSSGVLSNKTRTLDTASTSPVRLGKPTGVGPNAPASWGSVVRFRYPLPDETAIDGSSFDADREALFKGPPSVLQITVYEKKLLVDHALGTADVDMDGLFAGGQVEEWVPLRSDKHGIHWFTRIRLTLRFELMCLASRELKDLPSSAPSVGLKRIESLCQTGGAAAHEDHKRSISSPDLLQYLESMVY
ncbi:hypothetical protein ACA910_004128 [Epithemia clementina (nom. ined.)]